MKETWLFEYSAPKNLLGRMNPLLKLALLPLFCICTGLIPAPALLIPVIVIIPPVAVSPPAVKMQLAGMWKIWLFFIAAGIIKFFGNSTAAESAAFSLRLVLMTAAGLLFYTHTRVTAIRRSLEKILAPLPLVNGRYIADMISMSICFLPVVFKTMNELNDARKSRCFKTGRKPLRAIKLTAVPLMINMFLRTDEMADAWYSRGYSPAEINKKK